MSPIEFPYFFMSFYQNIGCWIILLYLLSNESHDSFRYHRWLENVEHGVARQDWQ